jgi:transposase
LFGWRRQAQQRAAAGAIDFTPVIVEGSRPGPDAAIAPALPGSLGMIEIVLGTSTVRLASGIDAAMLTHGAACHQGNDMIAVSAGVRILVATRPVDFRRGADSLAALVCEQLRQDPFSGTLFIFRSKRAQHATFCIQSSKREDCVSVASPFWTNASSRTVPTREGFEVHLHGGAAGV